MFADAAGMSEERCCMRSAALEAGPYRQPAVVAYGAPLHALWGLGLDLIRHTCTCLRCRRLWTWTRAE